MRSRDFRTSPQAAMPQACYIRRAPGYCRRDTAPARLLRAFVLRMAGHGVAVSCIRMQCDGPYALQQLACAHCTNDDDLRVMAMTLFLDFENRPAGVPSNPVIDAP